MKCKSSILVLFAIVAQSSLALNPSCSAPVSSIETDLKTIEFGEVNSCDGYSRVGQLIHDEISACLADKFGKISTSTEKAESRFQRAMNRTVSAYIFGIVPSLEAIQTLQPTIDIPDRSKIVSDGFRRVTRIIFAGIKAAQSEDHIEIARLSNLTQQFGAYAINLFNTAIANSATPVPSEAKSVVTCFLKKAEAEIGFAIGAIFDQIKLLAEGIHNVKVDGAFEKYSAEILAAHKRSAAFFEAEVKHKYAALRNLVKGAYLQKHGIVTGLFAIESAHR